MGQFIAEQAAAFFPADRLVMALCCFGCRGEKRCGQLGRFAQSARDLVSTHRSAVAVFVPRRTGQIPADHALDGQRFRFAAKHAAPGELFGERLQLGGESGEVRGNKMIRDKVQPLEPERGELGQHLAFSGDRVGQNAVESGKTVAGHQEHAVVRCVDLADLAAADQFPTGELQNRHGPEFTTGHPRPGKAQRRKPQIPWIRPAPRLACAVLCRS